MPDTFCITKNAAKGVKMKRVVALVTGSNRGIGASCIEEFAKQGVSVIINYCHHEKEAKDLEKYIKDQYGVDVLTIKCDI